jgi:hypothetical protein
MKMEDIQNGRFNPANLYYWDRLSHKGYHATVLAVHAKTVSIRLSWAKEKRVRPESLYERKDKQL